MLTGGQLSSSFQERLYLKRIKWEVRGADMLPPAFTGRRCKRPLTQVCLQCSHLLHIPDLPAITNAIDYPSMCRVWIAKFPLLAAYPRRSPVAI